MLIINPYKLEKERDRKESKEIKESIIVSLKLKNKNAIRNKKFCYEYISLFIIMHYFVVFD